MRGGAWLCTARLQPGKGSRWVGPAPWHGSLTKNTARADVVQRGLRQPVPGTGIQRAAVYLTGMNSLLGGTKFGRAVQSSSVLGGKSSPVTQQVLLWGCWDLWGNPLKHTGKSSRAICVPLAMRAECEAAAYEQIIRDLNSSHKQIPGG